MDAAQILIAGNWRKANSTGTFHAENPATGQPLPMAFPVSNWQDCDDALTAASHAAQDLRKIEPERIAAFLEAYANNIESSAAQIVEAAHEETALPISPRLKDVELPRTVNQLRQAAAAAREESWKRATLDLKLNIRACFAPIGPVVVLGPNNFPFAFNGISGGDFAAAIAAGNPVIAKAHPLHPNTTRLLAEEARKALATVGLPMATVQMIYQVNNDDGLRLMSDPRVGAIAFTGSRPVGLRLKEAAESVGTPIYLEMSSINPVIFLPGALEERGDQLAQELADSCLAGSGQFCTSPNLILLLQSDAAETLLQKVTTIFKDRPSQPLLSSGGREHLSQGVTALRDAGAQLVTGGDIADGPGYRYANTLLRANAQHFLSSNKALQREVFGNATLAVTATDPTQLLEVIRSLEGNLTGSIYSSNSGSDDAVYDQLAPALRRRVGRLLNDKMPTGVAVSPAMNHGGPYPSTSHPGFTAVGIPASLARFAALQCYDNVRQNRLPAVLKDKIENSATWRLIDGTWVRG
ncbi:MAG TPA: aldehyde dehydrogenase (NADP(+)) [Edaphobacter sp.]